MVTLQILVLSFLVRIQVAQQSGRFFDRFFLLSAWRREGRSDLRGVQSVCHDASIAPHSLPHGAEPTLAPSGAIRGLLGVLPDSHCGMVEPI